MLTGFYNNSSILGMMVRAQFETEINVGDGTCLEHFTQHINSKHKLLALDILPVSICTLENGLISRNI